jgi:hypothetical protein
MKFHDEDDFEDFDDGEAFANALVHIGQGLISHWFNYRAKHWPLMADGDFLPVLDAVRVNVGEFLGPEEIKELWGWVCWNYEEQCKAKDPKAKKKASAAVLQSCLPEWYQIASEVQPPTIKANRRGKKGKQ